MFRLAGCGFRRPLYITLDFTVSYEPVSASLCLVLSNEKASLLFNPLATAAVLLIVVLCAGLDRELFALFMPYHGT